LGSTGIAIGKVFDTIGISMKGLGEISRSFTKFLGEVFGPVLTWIADQAVKAWHTMEPELKKWGPTFSKISEAIGQVVLGIGYLFMNVLVPIFKMTLTLLLGMWKLFWPIWRDVLEPVLNSLIRILKATFEMARGIINFFLDLINGDWSKAWNDITVIFKATWDMLVAIVEAPFQIIWGLIKGLVQGIISFFTWLFDELVGHSIIPDMMHAIVTWFQWIFAPINAVWQMLWTAIKWYWNNIALPVFNFISSTVSHIPDAFNLAKDLVGSYFNLLGNVIRWVWDNLISPVFGLIRNGIGDVANVIDGVLNGISNTWNSIWNGMRNVFNSVWDDVKNTFNGAIGFIKGIWNSFVRTWNGIHIDIPKVHIPTGIGPGIDIGGGSVGLPNLPYLAKGGDIVRAGLAVVGERGPELAMLPAGTRVLPNNLSNLFQGPRVVHQAGNTTHTVHNHFYGDFMFPNIAKPEDADKFMRNLKNLVT
jgi:phage-related protein